MALLTYLRPPRALSYAQTVLALNPILYLPLNETSGTVADNAEGTAARDADYAGVTLASIASPVAGDFAPLLDGVNDSIDMHSASLDGVFNGQELTAAGWFKVSGAGVWTDGVHRRILSIEVDAQNIVWFLKNASANTLNLSYEAGNVLEINVASSFSSTDWVHLAVTASLSNDRVRFYIDGVQQGADHTGIGTWVGSLNSDRVALGVTSVNSQTNPFSGYLSHWAIFDYELPPAEILGLSQP